MKKNNLKNKTAKRLIMAAIASTSLSAYATINTTFNTNTPSSDAGQSAALDMLGKKIVALGFSAIDALNQSMYEFNQSIAKSIVVGNAMTQSSEMAQKNANILTNNYITDTLSTTPNQFLSTDYGAINGKDILKNIIKKNQLVNNLTLGVSGSDSLYINDPQTLSASYGQLQTILPKYYGTNTDYTIGAPPKLMNNYLSASSIMEKDSLNKDDAFAANAYLQYLYAAYNNPTSKLNYALLKSKIDAQPVKERAQVLYNFISNPQYQAYQLKIRSYMARRSVAVENLEHLIAERMPSKSAVSDIYDNQGNAITHPSALQVENYQAFRRVSDPRWKENLQTMSSTNVMREVALELATVIAQNEQQHLDTERLLTVQSTIELMDSDTSKTMSAGVSSGDINTLIKKIKTDQDSNNN